MGIWGGREVGRQEFGSLELPFASCLLPIPVFPFAYLKRYTFNKRDLCEGKLSFIKNALQNYNLCACLVKSGSR